MKRIVIAFTTAFITAAAPAVMAQAYPTKPVRIINPLAAICAARRGRTRKVTSAPPAAARPP